MIIIRILPEPVSADIDTGSSLFFVSEFYFQDATERQIIMILHFTLKQKQKYLCNDKL